MGVTVTRAWWAIGGTLDFTSNEMVKLRVRTFQELILCKNT